MKNLKLVAVIASIFVFGLGASAQTKIGYISLNDVISIMPELAKVDSTMKQLQKDSLESAYNQILESYSYRDSILNKADTSKTPKGVLNQYKMDLAQSMQELQNWPNIAQEWSQGKQMQLLQPLYQKAYKALQEVAKTGGYTYIADREAFIIAPAGDDLLPAVAKKLNITLPPTYKPGITIDDQQP